MKNVASVFKGNFISKFILAIAALFMAKWYGETDYGVFNVFLSLVAILSVVLPLSLDHLVILVKKKEESFNSFSAVSLLLLLNSALLVIFYFILKVIIGSQLYFPLIIGLISILSSLWMAFQLLSRRLLSRLKRFNYIAYLLIIDAVVSVLAQGLLYYYQIEYGLILGSAIGFFVSFLFAIYWTVSYLKEPDVDKFKTAIHNQTGLLKYTFSSNVLNSLGNNILPLLILSYFQASDVGEYSLALKLVSVPMLLVSGAIGTVFYPKAAELYNETSSNLFTLTKRVSRVNLSLNFVILVIVNLAAFFFLKMFFKEGWENLAYYISILSFWILGRSLVNPIADVIVVIKKNEFALIMNIYIILANVVALFLGYLYSSFEILLVSLSLLLGIGYITLYFVILNSIQKNVEGNN